MAQVKIYGLKENITNNRNTISDAIHLSVMSALDYPEEKKFHRFIPLDPKNFIFPNDRTENYIIIEISMFKGRSASAKKSLIDEIYKNINTKAGINIQDIEITITETPKENWGIRGMPGDELNLSYKVEV